MHNKKLSIAIPTYNRHDILYENLQHILPELVLNSIAVYISDDSNNDKTNDLVNELTKIHPFIYYVKNDPSFGHDKNILSTLQLPNTEYIWLLGDSVVIKNGSIRKLLNVLNTEYDFVFVNSYVNNATHITTIDDISFFKEFTWYLTLTGATIYNSNVIRSFCDKSQVHYYKNFQQIGIILDYVSDRVKAYWINDEIISFNTKKKSYWTSKVIDVFVNDWIVLIRSFPRVFKTEKVMNEVISSHAKNTTIFSFLNLLRYRSIGALNIDSIISNSKDIRIATRRSIIILLSISMIPQNLLILIRKGVKLILK
jgi:GT2 family glycosyltransferase